jgi:hypothetical protein
MKTSSQLLLNTTGTLLKEHAFDHLPDDKINLIRKSFQRLADMNIPLQERNRHQNDLLNYYSEADLLTESTTPHVIHQWQTVMSVFGRNQDHNIIGNNEEAD